MLEPRLLSHLKRHPLTHDQALRLRVLVTFRERSFSYQPADPRLLALGLAERTRPETVRVAAASLHVALAPDGHFRLPERHPFFHACTACWGSGVANEAGLFSRPAKRVIRCRACHGKGYAPAPSARPQG